MTITSADLKFFAADHPLDTSYGGGRRGGYAITTGGENNVFPDVPRNFRDVGGVQVRKVYPSVVSANAEPLMQAQTILSAGPADAALGVVLFPFGDQQTAADAARAAISAFPYVGIGYVNGSTVAGEPNKISFPSGFAAAVVGSPVLGRDGALIHVLSVATGTNDIYTFSGPVVPGVTNSSYQNIQPSALAAKAYGVATTTAAAGAGAVSLSINRVMAQVVPNITPYPATANGIEPAALLPTLGKVPIFRIGDAVVISGGGNSETRVVAFVDYRGALTLTTGLTNAYATGATVSSVVQHGDLQALVGPSFAQQTWTRAFSDTLIGNPITANYNRTAGVITTSNLGAITERWAIIFTSATAFRLVGERLGQIATGSTAAAFAPTNPATSAAYFTIPTAGWGSGWGTGNVLRFNTTGAYVPLWAARTVSPSAAGGVDGHTYKLRGSVNA